MGIRIKHVGTALSVSLLLGLTLPSFPETSPYCSVLSANSSEECRWTQLGKQKVHTEWGCGPCSDHNGSGCLGIVSMLAECCGFLGSSQLGVPRMLPPGQAQVHRALTHPPTSISPAGHSASMSRWPAKLERKRITKNKMSAKGARPPPQAHTIMRSRLNSLRFSALLVLVIPQEPQMMTLRTTDLGKTLKAFGVDEKSINEGLWCWCGMSSSHWPWPSCIFALSRVTPAPCPLCPILSSITELKDLPVFHCKGGG